MKIKTTQHNHFAFCLFTFAVLPVLLFQAGCKYGGLGGILGSPGYHEKKIPAEYNLTGQTDKKILVLVEQPGYLATQVNLRYYLTKSLRETLIGKAKLEPEQFISYTQLSEFRSSREDFPFLSPVEVGKALEADLILYVVLEDYRLIKIGTDEYYRGNLDAWAALFDTSTGEKLWPKPAKSKNVKVGFEVEVRGQEVAIARLATSSAYCTIRYLFDCPKVRFRIPDDRSTEAWESWGQ